jgi:hypothetical protein
MSEAPASALEFLIQVANDPNVDDKLRLRAAKAAAPYCHSTHQRVTVTGSDGRVRTVVREIPPLVL